MLRFIQERQERRGDINIETASLHAARKATQKCGKTISQCKTGRIVARNDGMQRASGSQSHSKFAAQLVAYSCLCRATARDRQARACAARAGVDLNFR